MINIDILRIMYEFQTFTNIELEEALESSSGSVATLLAQYARRKLVERVKVGKFTLNCLSEKGKRAVIAAPALDPQEILLPITWEGIVSHEAEITLPEIGNCRLCGHIIAKPEQFCERCLRMWEI